MYLNLREALIRINILRVLIFRASSPWNLRTFNQNLWSSRFFGTWSSDQQVFTNEDAHQSFQSSWSSKLDQIQFSFLPCSSELQVLGNWRRSLRTSGLQTSLALGSSESSSLECWRRSSELLSSETSST